MKALMLAGVMFAGLVSVAHADSFALVCPTKDAMHAAVDALSISQNRAFKMPHEQALRYMTNVMGVMNRETGCRFLAIPDTQT